MNLTYESLSEMWASDSDIDSNDITNETIRTTKLHSKYYSLYIEQSLKLRTLEAKKAKLIADKHDYFSGSMDIEDVRDKGWQPLPRMIIKNDVQRHIDSDDQIIEINLKIAYARSMTDYLESIVKMITNRGYNLRLIFDFERFRSGG